MTELFSAAVPRLWNDLPLDIKSTPSILVFKSGFKTYLFTTAYRHCFFFFVYNYGKVAHRAVFVYTAIEIKF